MKIYFLLLNKTEQKLVYFVVLSKLYLLNKLDQVELQVFLSSLITIVEVNKSFFPLSFNSWSFVTLV